MKKQPLSIELWILLIGLFGFFSFTIQAQNNHSTKKSAKSNNTPVTKVSLPKQYDIYVAGASYNGKTSKHTAVYWKNGQPIPLTDGQSDAEATSIVVIGDDVYTSGIVDGQAVYWKNEHQIQLSNKPGAWARVYSIAVVANNVYVAGYERDTRRTLDDIAIYWKNGVPELLPGSNRSTAKSIAVVNNDVYVIGSENYKTAYWKNGQKVASLNNGLDEVSAITQLDGVAYAVGNKNKQAAYWKNGRTEIVTTGLSRAVCIAVSGDDVYAGGIIDSNGTGYIEDGDKGVYWKNGQAVAELSVDGDPLWPTSITVAGSDVYITARNQFKGERLFKNGQEVRLSNGQEWGIANFVVSVNTGSIKLKTSKPALVKKEKQEYIKPLNPKEEGEKFLAQNKKKPGIITTPSGLQYQVLKEGTGPKPLKTNQVEVSYKAMLINGDLLDSSENNGGNTIFPLNGSMIEGFSEGIQLMKVGSKYKFFIPSNLAYGDKSSGMIKAGSTLIFEIELLRIAR